MKRHEKSPWMSHGIAARYPVMRTPPWRWSCRKLLRGECEGRLCAILSPDICIEAQRSYDECTKTRFTVDLSGARSRRWKSEVLSIGEHWHPHQRGSIQADGSYVLEIPYSDERELMGDVLRFGADVEVMAPPDLRGRIKRALHEAVGRYV